MFTGIVTAIGTIAELTRYTADRARHLSAGEEVEIVVSTTSSHPTFLDIKKGDSISCSGCCLTATESPVYKLDSLEFRFYLVQETLKITNFKYKRIGSVLNLETSLRIGDQIGGHIVTGHIDTTSTVTDVTNTTGGKIIELEIDPIYHDILQNKGSIAIEGISLTISEVTPKGFKVNLIPETLKRSTSGNWKAGEKLNTELDTVAKQVTKITKLEIKRQAQN